MADTKEKLTNYAIGAGIGLAIYHFYLRKKYPNTFPALSEMSKMNQIGETGCSNCGQR